MKVLSLQEAKEDVRRFLDEQRKKGLVRCLNCQHRHKLVPNQSRFGSNGRDMFCPVNVNGVVLLNAMQNDQALTAWRRCNGFEPDGEKKEEA